MQSLALKVKGSEQVKNAITKIIKKPTRVESKSKWGVVKGEVNRFGGVLKNSYMKWRKYDKRERERERERGYDWLLSNLRVWFWFPILGSDTQELRGLSH